MSSISSIWDFIATFSPCAPAPAMLRVYSYILCMLHHSVNFVVLLVVMYACICLQIPISTHEMLFPCPIHIENVHILTMRVCISWILDEKIVYFSIFFSMVLGWSEILFYHYYENGEKSFYFCEICNSSHCENIFQVRYSVKKKLLQTFCVFALQNRTYHTWWLIDARVCMEQILR